VGDADRSPHPPFPPVQIEDEAHPLTDLILLRAPHMGRPTKTRAWLEAYKPGRWFHAVEGMFDDTARIARIVTGSAVGVVLSGGGARAYAHIGAIQAMRERGIPIDFVGGASMGAIVAAGIAMGWDDGEMETRIRKAFVDTSPLDDIAFPLVAMTQGLKVKARLAEHFDDIEIADLWLPFFCVSSNLTSGAYHLHRQGVLREALRASISLPGVLPPVADGNSVLVDGAVMKNFPADVMRAFQLGPIVGVDVTRGRSITADDVDRPTSLWRWLWSGEWRKGPPIVALLMRAATVSTGRDLAASREASDVLITPKLNEVDIRDWKAFEPAVAAGRAAAALALDSLGKPVTELRRRSSLADLARAEVNSGGRSRTAG
jgi:NTE family protein